jgi:hypothetical protein
MNTTDKIKVHVLVKQESPEGIGGITSSASGSGT